MSRSAFTLVAAGLLAAAFFYWERVAGVSPEPTAASEDASGATVPEPSGSSRSDGQRAARVSRARKGEEPDPLQAQQQGPGHAAPESWADEPATAAADEAPDLSAVEQSTDGAPARLTAEEEAIMGVYDEMALVLEKASGNCDVIGLELENLVDRNLPVAKRLQSAQAGLTPEARLQAQVRVERAAADRIERVRELLRINLSKCMQNERLMAALRRLASTGLSG